MESAYSEHDAANIIAQLVDVVQYLNDIGIAHRDIKPENIIYVDSNSGPDAKVKLTDLGLAKSRESDMQMMTPCGTPSYVAPEVLKQAGYGFECDMWSIGVITYILLCGYQPFWEDPPMLYNSIMAGSYTMPVEEWEGISDLAKDLISKLLVVDASKRLTPAEVLDHAWIRGHVSKTLERGVLPETTSIKLKAFNAKRSFRMAGLKVMASIRMGLRAKPTVLPHLPAPCEDANTVE
eukprot:TRINITY_DN19961_c0_g1_i4.p1 TRINITY_DN19961_c0_g1~~TRINITY_DN19961_c0_g1_i4.p1  ORF type:complete len:236 (+),score=37.91 TRINITY_DN19961_c0_g1_i4:97-804(+)